MISTLLPFFRKIFGSSLFTYFAYPCMAIGLIAFMFLILYSFFDRRCN